MTKLPKRSEIEKAVIAASDRAKGDVVEDVEAFEFLPQAMQEIHHGVQ